VGLLQCLLLSIRRAFEGALRDSDLRTPAALLPLHQLLSLDAVQLGYPFAFLAVKCLNRQEFVVVGWTNPEGSRPHLGALLLGYYADDGKLVYAGRVGTGMSEKVLKDLRRRLDPLARPQSPLNAPPPRSTRFGSPLVLSRVHWVDPALVAEITYLTWTADNLLRQTVYVGLREDKPADQVRRE
jgi:ATP-dependent DNA ligase